MLQILFIVSKANNTSWFCWKNQFVYMFLLLLNLRTYMERNLILCTFVPWLIPAKPAPKWSLWWIYYIYRLFKCTDPDTIYDPLQMWPKIRHTLPCRRFTHSHVSWQECVGLLICGSFHGDNGLKITAETAFPCHLLAPQPPNVMMRSEDVTHTHSHTHARLLWRSVGWWTQEGPVSLFLNPAVCENVWPHPLI